MLSDDILESLAEKKSLEELQSEFPANRKKLRACLKSMVQDGLVETDGETYRKREKKPSAPDYNFAALALLSLIVLLGFFLRSYHSDYAVVGYHNWKETHYLTEARNFARDGFFKYGIFVPAWDYPFLDADPSGAHSDTFPTISVIVAFFFMVLGPELWVARMAGILFNLGTVVFMYLSMKKLFRREDIAIVSALLTATLPLYVFFSHNVDLINPGLFFMMASLYFFLCWRESLGGKDMVLAALFLALAGLTKYPFLVIAIPMFFGLPYKKLKDGLPALKSRWTVLLACAIILSSIPLWFIYSERIIGNKYGTQAYTLSEGGMIQLEALSDPQWWATQQAYIRDNYTLTGFFMAGLGAAALLLMLALHYSKKAAFGDGDRFLLFYFLAAAPFVTVMSYKLGGHSYHQYPIAPLVIILIAYLAARLGDLARYVVRNGFYGNVAAFAVMAFVLSFYAVSWTGLLLPPDSSLCQAGFCETFGTVTARQFDTQFPGLDIAGEYIKEHSEPDERIIFPSHQSYGVLWHADRKGYKTPGSVEDIIKAGELGATWFFIYQWGFSITQDADRWSYVKEHYSLKQMAFVQTQQGNEPIYLLLRKGGSFDESMLDFSGREVKSRDYEYTGGRFQRLYYVNFE